MKGILCLKYRPQTYSRTQNEPHLIEKSYYLNERVNITCRERNNLISELIKNANKGHCTQACFLYIHAPSLILSVSLSLCR